MEVNLRLPFTLPGRNYTKRSLHHMVPGLLHSFSVVAGQIRWNLLVDGWMSPVVLEADSAATATPAQSVPGRFVKVSLKPSEKTMC
jgi:hypothetical protein